VGVVRPSGPLPAGVYWRRRFVVLGVPVLVLALLVWLVAGRGSSGAQASSSGSTSSAHATTAAKSTKPSGSTKAHSSAGPTPSTTPTGAGVPDCPASALTLSVAPGAAAYAAGVSPAFTVTITNAGTQTCLVDAGDAHRAVVVSSGKDRVWASQDCAKPATASRVLLLPPGAKDSQRVVWNRARSAAGCPANPAAAKAGSYKVDFHVDAAKATTASFRLS
jgi:hypothetical protein